MENKLDRLDVAAELERIAIQLEREPHPQRMSPEEATVRWDLEAAGRFPRWASADDRESYILWRTVLLMSRRWRRDALAIRPPLFLRVVVAWRGLTRRRSR